MNKKQNSLMLVLAVIAGLVGGVMSSRFWGDGFVFAQKTPQRIEAEAFLLVDRNGEYRAMLGFSSDGRPGFCLFDRDGRSRFRIETLRNGISVLSFMDEDENVHAMLNKSGLFFTGDEEVRVMLNESALVLSDKDGNIRATLTESELVFRDEDATTIWHAP